MFSLNSHDRTILEISQGDFIAIAVESFLIDRQAGELSKHTIRFYRQFLNPFIAFCEASSLKLIQEITPDFLRRYFLTFAETHDPGGVHAAYSTIRAFFRWVLAEEVMPPDWKNPMLKVKAPKVFLDPLEPIAMEHVKALLNACRHGDFFGERERAIFLFLLDTGLRAQELCNLNTRDLDLNTGSVMIRYGKGGKTRIVFIGRKTKRSIRSYLSMRRDESSTLFVSKYGEQLTYDGLRQIIERRSKLAGLKNEPTLHDFRRQFALSMLNNGVDIFSLQRLMGHSDVSILRRYLAQTTEDIRVAHVEGSPVENFSWS